MPITGGITISEDQSSFTTHNLPADHRIKNIIINVFTNCEKIGYKTENLKASNITLT